MPGQEQEFAKVEDIQKIVEDTQSILMILKGDERRNTIGMCERLRIVEHKVEGLKAAQTTAIKAVLSVGARIAPWLVSAVAGAALWKSK